MSQRDRDLIQRMGIKPRCPICRAYYGNNVRLVKGEKDHFLFHIQCPSCHSYIINVTLDNLIGVSSLYMVTDLTREDLAKFFDGIEVACDEVIETYEQLTKQG